MPSRDEWKSRIIETSGFNWIEEPIKLDYNKTLFITHCCAEKNPNLSEGKAEELYIGNRNQRFYKQVKSRHLRYCTLSDKYGIIQPTDIIQTYNVAPSDLTEEGLIELKERVAKQLPKDINTIVYFGVSPSMTEFYLKMFKNVNLTKYFITRFCWIDKVQVKALF